jgi:hypothetical protein
MGLLMSDTTLIDPILDDMCRLQDSLVEYVYATDLVCDESESEASEPTAEPTSWPLLLIWPHQQLAHV